MISWSEEHLTWANLPLELELKSLTNYNLYVGDLQYSSPCFLNSVDLTAVYAPSFTRVNMKWFS